ncbi:MAG: response regulator [Parasporobacterium sp.]|nr:response regulator [Parasporobacterium sp.]
MNSKKITTLIAVIGIVAVMVILVFGNIWMGHSARQASNEAVRTVSLLYLDELAGRREQVVADNLKSRTSDMQTALDLMTEEDLSDMEHLQAYQAKMKRLFTLEKFAFVDENGLIYTSLGTQTDIENYRFDYLALEGPDISIKNLNTSEKTVIIAVPLERISFNGEKLVACFMEISMKEMLAGVSMNTQNSEATFSNLYTKDGVALSDTVLGGLAEEDNLLAALSMADYEEGYSYEKVCQDFESLTSGEASFTYNGIRETLSYAPVEGTDWLLTYLIRESVISDQIGSISDRIIRQSIVQSIVTVLVMLAVFAYIIAQNRKNNRLRLEKETADAEIRGKQEELEQRIALQKQLEDQSQALSDALHAAEQANKAKTAFLSNMSHEIRTPMNAIIGLDNIALNDPEISDRTREYLSKIGASADHLLGLINDILDMSRIESGRMTLKNEEFSFSKLLEAINTMFSGQCQEKGLDYQCRIHGHVDDYYIGDNMKLRQVLINILGNAVKFTPEGGSVALTIDRMAQYENQSTLRFTIADTGIGMSPDYLPHIFETFSQEDSSSTSRYGSSGLGMAITKSIVEMMNGNIQVDSEKGKGTTFTVTLTLMDSDRTDTDADASEIHLSDMAVLVVDDDPVACEHAKLVLEKACIAVETASSGEEALSMVQLRQTRMNPYNLILVDWKMPEMDGVETTRRIRSIVGDDSAIIILTAYRWDDVLEEALQAGVDSFLPKPLFVASVIEEFQSAARKKEQALHKNQKKADLTGRHILLAEDMEVNAEIMTMVLQMRQMEPDLAENGRIAVEKFASHPAGYYDAILMDMRMPEMDGLEATRRIRAMDREDAGTIPVIALTANAFDEDVQRSLQAGLNAHLSKPVQPEVLYETLENLIRD